MFAPPPVLCRRLRYLRDLLYLHTPGTGDCLDCIITGDAAVSGEVPVIFTETPDKS